MSRRLSKLLLATLAWCVVMLASTRTFAHAMPNSAVEMRVNARSIDVHLTLPLIELKLGWQQPIPLDADEFVRAYGKAVQPYVLEHVRPTSPDGRPWTVQVMAVEPMPDPAFPDVGVELRMTPPPGAPVDRFDFHYDVIFHQLITHSAIVSITSDWRSGFLNGEPILLGMMDDHHLVIPVDRTQGSWSRGFTSVFQLGMRHIAEGTDHLLFLLALLLPAPLLVDRGRWSGFAGAKLAIKRIVKIVSAFTVGHSITLVLGATGWIHLPSRWIEAAIAVSIFISAVHALVPMFAGKEIYIAGGFGLIHGLAFASTLTAFGFDAVTMVSSVFAFNIGIELVQLLVILVTMPWLIMLSRTILYAPFRIVAACVTGIAAAAWFFERAFGWHNPVGPGVEVAAAHASWIVVGLATMAILATIGTRAFGRCAANANGQPGVESVAS